MIAGLVSDPEAVRLSLDPDFWTDFELNLDEIELYISDTAVSDPTPIQELGSVPLYKQLCGIPMPIGIVKHILEGMLFPASEKVPGVPIGEQTDGFFVGYDLTPNCLDTLHRSLESWFRDLDPDPFLITLDGKMTTVAMPLWFHCTAPDTGQYLRETLGVLATSRTYRGSATPTDWGDPDVPMAIKGVLQNFPGVDDELYVCQAG